MSEEKTEEVYSVMGPDTTLAELVAIAGEKLIKKVVTYSVSSSHKIDNTIAVFDN